MRNKHVILVILAASLSITALSVYSKKYQNKRFNELVESINELFDIKLPLEVNEITVYCENWQASGVYIYFEIPSNYLQDIKNDEIFWQEISEEFRSLPCSTEAIKIENFKQAKSYNSLLRIESYFRLTLSHYKIHNNVPEKIQWFYYKDEGGEKVIRKMISEPVNGIYRCYYSDGDLTYSEKGKYIQQIVPSEKSITFHRPDNSIID